jgi:hypothetical protein
MKQGHRRVGERAEQAEGTGTSLWLWSNLKPALAAWRTNEIAIAQVPDDSPGLAQSYGCQEWTVEVLRATVERGPHCHSRYSEGSCRPRYLEPEQPAHYTAVQDRDLRIVSSGFSLHVQGTKVLYRNEHANYL